MKDKVAGVVDVHGAVKQNMIKTDTETGNTKIAHFLYITAIQIEMDAHPSAHK